MMSRSFTKVMRNIYLIPQVCLYSSKTTDQVIGIKVKPQATYIFTRELELSTLTHPHWKFSSQTKQFSPCVKSSYYYFSFHFYLS